jgi:hypothetical protein
MIDGWEPMTFSATLPRQEWTRSIRRAAESDGEYYLEREVVKEGKRYEPCYCLQTADGI